MAPDEDSEHLRKLEEHAAETKEQAQAGGSAPEGEEEAAADTPAAESAGDDDSDYGVENDMRPGGPAAGDADPEEPVKRIDEDVTGEEETEHMSELHTDD
jgi:hypothetical protein